MHFMKFLIPLFLFPGMAFADCRPAIKLVAMVNLEKNKVIESFTGKAEQKICINTNAANSNLELVFSKGKNKHSEKVFSNLAGYYDYLKKDNSLGGGRYKLKSFAINTWAPAWYKGGNLTIIDISSGKKLIEVKL